MIGIRNCPLRRQLFDETSELSAVSTVTGVPVTSWLECDDLNRMMRRLPDPLIREAVFVEQLAWYDSWTSLIA